jgi:cytochrome c553
LANETSAFGANRQRRPEGVPLTGVQWVFWCVRARQVAHDAAQIDPVEARRIIPELRKLLGREPEARHAGVDVQRRRHFGGAQTVSVGLDDGGAFGRRHAPAQQPPVGDDRAQIDEEHRAGLVTRCDRCHESG